MKSSRIKAPGLLSAFRPEYGRNAFLFDPDEPHKGPEEIQREMRGRMTDPYAVNHHCPMCERTMAWELFRAHLMDCYRRNRLTKLDITKRKFAGATPKEETNA